MRPFLLCCLTGCLISSGCGTQTYPVAKTTGLCLCEGEPIPSGWVQLSPIAEDNKTMPGKSAMGKVEPDGTFVLSTYQDGDGAVTGKHRVRVMEPTMPERREIAEGAEVPVKHGCVLPEDLIIEITPAVDNDLTIKLIKKSKSATSQSRPTYEG